MQLQLCTCTCTSIRIIILSSLYRDRFLHVSSRPESSNSILYDYCIFQQYLIGMIVIIIQLILFFSPSLPSCHFCATSSVNLGSSYIYHTCTCMYIACNVHTYIRTRIYLLFATCNKTRREVKATTYIISCRVYMYCTYI